ncbi:hypothetical protein H4R21_000687 [Coemansia helicoidea]|uniref:Uncharacterized protein n=1 Tax=Coemansia helicoidea TaxID=1286919 RepID=A0ACC1LF31_9FUNG|nr:hypothetical protein H4R21_000687 [Coemansia helicoidea]
MDIAAAVAAVVQCVEPGSPGRAALADRLSQLLRAIQSLKSAPVPPAMILMHTTLAAARLFAPAVLLGDRERELALECAREALSSHGPIIHVPAVVVDHLARILVSQFAVSQELMRSGGALPEPARKLAIECWGRLAANVATVSVPRGGSVLPPRGPTDTVSLREYFGRSLPGDYLALVVCGLLDNAEAADDQQLRKAALEALAQVLADGALLGPTQAAAIIPGVASALARIALAQPLGGPTAPDQSMTGGMQKLSLAAEPAAAPRKPTVPVRAHALKALESAVLLVYGAAPGPQQQEAATASAVRWAEQSRAQVESILSDSAPPASDSDGKDEQTKLQRLLWRLAGLRHTEGLRAPLFALFAAASLDCPGLHAAAVAIEACVVMARSQQAPAAASAYMARLARRCSDDQGLGGRVQGLLEEALALAERYLRDGSEQQRADVLCLVAGYVDVLGAERARPLVSPWWAASGAQALLDSLAVSLPGTSLLIADVGDSRELSAAAPAADGDGVAYVLDSYRTAELEHALGVFVACIASVVTPAVLCEQLLGRLYGAGTIAASPSALWLLTWVARQTADLGRTYQSTFQYCVDYLGSAPPADGGSEDGLCAPGESDRTLGTSMVLDVVAATTPAVGPSIAYYLDTLLFPLLQTLAQPSPLLRTQARRTLGVLAHTMQADSVAAMLRGNVDYIVEGCARQIRSVALHPHVFEILAGAVQLVGRDILPYMDDVVEDTLDACEAAPDADVTTSALQFLEIVTRTIAEESRAPQIEGRRPSLGLPDDDPIGSALAEMADIDERAAMAEFVSFDDAEPAGQLTARAGAADEDGAGEDPAGDPLAIKIALAVQAFLSSESGAQQLVALKTVSNALGALRATRDLLPLVNEVWPLLVHRLARDHDSFYVALAACDVVEAVCALGASWMRQRVRDDLWVHFARILADAVGSHRASETEAARRVLGAMATVVRCVPLDDRTAWALVAAAVPFFGHAVLEPPLVDLLHAMVPLYADKIWLVLAKLGAADARPADIPAFACAASAPVPPGICQRLGL